MLLPPKPGSGSVRLILCNCSEWPPPTPSRRMPRQPQFRLWSPSRRPLRGLGTPVRQGLSRSVERTPGVAKKTGAGVSPRAPNPQTPDLSSAPAARVVADRARPVREDAFDTHVLRQHVDVFAHHAIAVCGNLDRLVVPASATRTEQALAAVVPASTLTQAG